MEGRADSAPQTRRGNSDRVTMGGTELQHLEESNPRMPHLEYPNLEDLSRNFPSLSVPADVGDDHEVHWDSWDKIYQRGQEIIDQIQNTMDTQGRRRNEDSSSAAIAAR